MQPGSWSYEPENATNKRHLTTEEVRGLPDDARKRNMNLLLNTGPLPEGGIHKGDVAILREVGNRIKG